jgi:hypothetical protein
MDVVISRRGPRSSYSLTQQLYQRYYLLTYLLAYLLHGAESSLEASRFAASQEIPHILWNLKVSEIVGFMMQNTEMFFQVKSKYYKYQNSFKNTLQGTAINFNLNLRLQLRIYQHTFLTNKCILISKGNNIL